jgi:hypothetical protein
MRVRMDSFLKMDIFFGVTTLAVVVLTIVLVVVAVRALALLKKVDDLLEMARESGEQIQEDIEEVRATIRRGGSRIGHFFGLLGAAPKKRTRTSRKTTGN